MAVIAWWLVFQWRASCYFATGWIVYLQPVLSIVLAVVCGWMLRTIDLPKYVGWRLAPWGMAGMVVPLAVDVWERDTFHYGTPWEVLSMMVFANWTLMLATLSRIRRYQNLTAIFAGASVFVVISMVEGSMYSLPAGVYLLLLLWWSMTSHWQRLEQKFADQHRSEFSVRATVIVSTIAGMMGLTGLLLAWASTGALNARGVSWFSGGERYSDDFARDGSGVGDGIKAATQNPLTFGPVESDLFLESQHPTLYDVSSDLYGEPKKIRKRSRAIGIDSELMRYSELRIAKNQQASGEFSVARKPRPQAQRAVDDKLTSILFYVKGPAPTWLALETFNHFEEGTWSQRDPDPAVNRRWRRRPVDGVIYRDVIAESGSNKPWMKIGSHETSPTFGGWDYSAVKFVNFRSLRIPSPPCLEQMYIDRVDRPDFFLIGSDEIPQLNNNDSYIPPDTVVHLLSARINLYQAKTQPQMLRDLLEGRRDVMAEYLNAESVSEEVADLADRWTRGLQSDWFKVEAIVCQLQSLCELDRDVVLPNGETDAAQFLIETRTGTDYMFATTAASMFRSLGIPSRFVQGFWVDPQRLDRKSGHTAVTAQDLHVWVEISLDGETWIPVEPTPGYPSPRYYLTIPQRMALACYFIGAKITRHPVMSLLTGLMIVFLIWNYKWLIHGYQTLIWTIKTRLDPDAIIVHSARLIDQRLTLAGLPRPASVTSAKYSFDLVNRLDWQNDDRQLVARFANSLNRELYHPLQLRPGSELISTVRDCRQLVSKLRFGKLLQFRKLQGNFNHV